MARHANRMPTTLQPFEADPGGPGVLLLRGELDLAGGPVLWRALDDLGRVAGDRLVLDVSQLTFIDATGARAIAHVYARLRNEGADVVVRHPQPAVRRTLELCRFDGWLAAPEEVDLEIAKLDPVSRIGSWAAARFEGPGTGDLPVS